MCAQKRAWVSMYGMHRGVRVHGYLGAILCRIAVSQNAMRAPAIVHSYSAVHMEAHLLKLRILTLLRTTRQYTPAASPDSTRCTEPKGSRCKWCGVHFRGGGRVSRACIRVSGRTTASPCVRSPHINILLHEGMPLAEGKSRRGCTARACQQSAKSLIA